MNLVHYFLLIITSKKVLIVTAPVIAWAQTLWLQTFNLDGFSAGVGASVMTLATTILALWFKDRLDRRKKEKMESASHSLSRVQIDKAITELHLQERARMDERADEYVERTEEFYRQQIAALKEVIEMQQRLLNRRPPE